MAIDRLEIPHWLPTRLNQLVGVHWSTVQKYKSIDRDMVFHYARLAGLKPAEQRRKVSLDLTLRKGQRGGDPDSLWKSLLDALVHAKLLKNDSSRWVELGKVTFSRGAFESTTIVLEDVA